MPTHGSLTKAGKVRAQTPPVDKTNFRKNPSPIRKNRRNFNRRINRGLAEKKRR